jgi:hypothetical protein
MGKLRQLCHWLTGPETSIEVSAFVPPTHPLRQWADGLPWAPFVEATAQSLARRFVRETGKRLLSIGSKVLPLALSALKHLQRDIHLAAAQQERLMHQLDQALEAHRPIEKQSRQLVRGQKLDHGKIVNPYDRTIALSRKVRVTVRCIVSRPYQWTHLKTLTSGFLHKFPV